MTLTSESAFGDETVVENTVLCRLPRTLVPSLAYRTGSMCRLYCALLVVDCLALLVAQQRTLQYQDRRRRVDRAVPAPQTDHFVPLGI